MKIRTSLFRPLAVCVAVIFISISAFAQATPEKPGESFNFVLKLVAGVQGADVKDGLPAGWDKVEKHLRSTFSVKGFETIGTFGVRGAIGGTAGYEGSWNMRASDGKRLSTIRFSLSNLSRDGGTIAAKNANFYLEIPPIFDPQQGAKARDEQVFKLTLYGLALEANTPTVLGSLQIVGVDGPVFVVLTARTL